MRKIIVIAICSLVACTTEPGTTTKPDPVRCQIGNPNCPGSPPSDSDYINAANQLSIQTAVATGDGSSGTITDKTTCTLDENGESKTCSTHVVLNTFWIFELSCDITCVDPPWPPSCSGHCGITTAIPPAMASQSATVERKVPGTTAGVPIAGARCQIGDPNCASGNGDPVSPVDPSTVPNVAQPALNGTSSHQVWCSSQDSSIRCCSPDSFAGDSGTCCTLTPFVDLNCTHSIDIRGELDWDPVPI